MALSLFSWNRTFVCLIYLSLVLSAQITSKELVDGPITYNLRYSWFWKISANWSTTTRKSDWSMQYPVVTYTEYAPTLEQFIERYPYVTIETTGQAYSDETFGDVGRDRFGTLTFETRHFMGTDYDNLSIVSSYLNHFTFDVGAEIGVGFKNAGYKLYMRPFCNGWIYSVGAKWRSLHFGLGITSITFHPKSDKQVVSNLISA